MNHSFFYHTIVLLSILSYCILSAQENNKIESIVVVQGDEIYTNAIEYLFSHEEKIERLTFDSDVYFDHDEFLYLINFKEGDIVNTKDVIRAVQFLVKKNKFECIRLQVIPGVNGIWLHFDFKSFWTFKKIKISGVFQGKDMYRRYYILQAGDVFDCAQHGHGKEKIRQALQYAGYFNCKVNCTLDYEQTTKEVTVNCEINKGKRFGIGSVIIEVNKDEYENNYVGLEHHIKKRLLQKLTSQKYSKELINQEAISLKRFLEKKGFLQTSFELEESINKKCKKVDLFWRITIFHKREFVFFGNRFFSYKQLREKILAFGRSAWLLPSSILAEEIERAYKEKGFWCMKVDIQEEKDRSFFVIKEGQRAVVRKVAIKNTYHFDQSYLIKHCFSQLLKRTYYDVQYYNDAIGLLTALYMKEGFLSFSVVDHEFVKIENKNKNEYVLIVTIDEGKRSYVTSIKIENYPELEKYGPFKKFYESENPLSFDTKDLDEQRAWLVTYFRNVGYMYPKIKPIIETKEHKVFVQWKVDPGEKIRFGKTIVLGSTQFPFLFLQQSLHYQQGELWNQEKIRQTFLTLKELEVFETIHLVPDLLQKGEEKTIIVKIKEDDRFEIRARSGLELQHVRKYQTFGGLTYKLGGTALVKNPCNVGDQIRLDLDFTRSHREVVALYRRPWFLPSPLHAIFQVYSISHDHPGFIKSCRDIYTIKQHGFLVGLNKKIKHTDCGLNGGFEWMKTKIKDTILAQCLARAINFEPLLLDKTVPFFFIEPTCIIEYLDDTFNPTHGALTVFSLKGMVPLESEHKDSFFFKFLFEQSFFIPLKKVVAAFRIRFGHIFHRQLRAIMPSERFYLGGSHSLRGYEADLAPPLGIFVDEENEEFLVPRGGRSMANINIELRIPIFHKKLAGVIFQDFGALSSDMFADFKPQNALAATGFGARFFTPLGPLRFDIGWKWKKQSDLERRFAWFLTFGHAF